MCREKTRLKALVWYLLFQSPAPSCRYFPPEQGEPVRVEVGGWEDVLRACEGRGRNMVRGVRFLLLGLSMRPWCPLGQERTQPGPPWFAGVSTEPALILPAAPLSPSTGQGRQLGCLCRPARKQPCLPSPFPLSRDDKETEEEWPGQGDITARGGGEAPAFSSIPFFCSSLPVL